MNPTVLIVAALATWQAVEIWHHSSLFATTRARVELCEGRLAELLLCPFCLSVWVALAAVLWLAGADRLPRPWDVLAAVPCWALAASRLANLGNDLAHGFTRTPKSGTLPLSGAADAGEAGNEQFDTMTPTKTDP